MEETKTKKPPEPPAKTAFTDQRYELLCDGYECTDRGVRTKTGKVVCLHPIMPVAAVEDVEDHTVSLTVAYNANGYWDERTYPRTVLASSNAILGLSAAGIAVTSENARALSGYLTNLYHNNDHILPKKWSMAHLGWVSKYSDKFAPYAEGICFGGENSMRLKLDAVHFAGDERSWIDAVLPVWKGSLAARLTVAAACASALLTPLDLQPFFVHIWGRTGLGKTVLLQIAASVWGDPAPGKLISTFNATATGLETTAAFLHDLPLLVDELQIVSGPGKSDFQQTIYALAEGVGKTRGAKDGGLRKQPTWRNTIVTTGERPISADGIGGGAMNRCIELELTEPVTKDFAGLLDAISLNYGVAGYRFVEFIKEKRAALPVGFKKYLRELIAAGVTGKQAAAMAALRLADAVCCVCFFTEHGVRPDPLSVEQVAPLLLANADVCMEEKALEYLFDTVAANPAHFPVTVDAHRPVEVWGKPMGEYTAVIGKVFNSIMEEGGFSPRAVLAYADRKGLLEKDGSHYKKNVNIYGKSVRCAVIRQPSDEGETVANKEKRE